MKRLTQADCRAIASYDAAQARSNNANRFYKFLVTNGDDLEIHTVTVKSRKDGSAAVKEVIRASALSQRVLIKDVVIHYIAGYLVDWSPEKLGGKRDWSYEGKWSTTTYDGKSHVWKLRVPVVNPDTLLQSPRFRWCAYTPECGDILDYLKTYVKHPRIELLAKAGIGRLAQSKTFVHSLETNSSLARYVAANLHDIVESKATVTAIRKAYASAGKVADMQRHINNLQFMRRNNLPEELDADRVLAYLDRQKIQPDQYVSYIDNCQTARLALTDTKNAYPINFAQREATVEARALSIKRRHNKEQARRLNTRILTVAKMLRQAERMSGPFVVRFPRNELDLIREGKTLHHCVGYGRYAKDIADGQTIIAFIRKPESPATPFVTVAFNPKQQKVTACYGAHNSLPPPEVNTFVHGTLENTLAKQAG